MLVRTHAKGEYSEDFGLLTGSRVHLYESGVFPRIQIEPLLPVIRVNALWVSRKVGVKCDVADTQIKKRVGLQSYNTLPKNAGLYFPYLPYTDVVFHQGSVPFPLDILFLRDSQVCAIKKNTEVGSSERWGCKKCDGVIEVAAGFCEENDVHRGDKIALFAFTKKDFEDLANEAATIGIVAAISEEMLSEEEGY